MRSQRLNVAPLTVRSRAQPAAGFCVRDGPASIASPTNDLDHGLHIFRGQFALLAQNLPQLLKRAFSLLGRFGSAFNLE